HGIRGMSAQEHSIPYGPGAYRSNALPDLPPSRQQQGGLFETPLRWGHYSGLDSPVEAESQLESEAHKAYEEQLAAGQKPLIFCDALRCRFAHSSFVPSLLCITKLLSFFRPIFFLSTKIAATLILSLFSLIGALSASASISFFGTKKQNYA